MTIDIPHYPMPAEEQVKIKQDPVERSLARPDACAKPCSIGKAKTTAKVRIRPTNQRQPGRPRKRKRDVRDVRFF